MTLLVTVVVIMIASVLGLLLLLHRRRSSSATISDDRCQWCTRSRIVAAPTLVCPGCGREICEYNETFLARRVIVDGKWYVPCADCDRETFVFGPESVCTRCERLRPDANEHLERRFDALDGQAPREGGFCPGCHEAGKALPIEIDIGCPSCECSGWVAEADIDKNKGARVWCSTCSAAFTVPPSVWCPNCGLNLRRDGVKSLIMQANRRY